MPRKQRRRTTRGRSGSSSSNACKSSLDGAEAGDGFVHPAEVRAVRLVERGQGPRLGAQPGLMTLRPCFLGRGEAATVTEQEFGEAVPGAQEIGADVFYSLDQNSRAFARCQLQTSNAQLPRSPANRMASTIGSWELGVGKLGVDTLEWAGAPPYMTR